MLKRLTRKLLTLFVLVAALAALSSAPASATVSPLICWDVPMTSDCETGIMCCDTLSGNCQCGG